MRWTRIQRDKQLWVQLKGKPIVGTRPLFSHMARNNTCLSGRCRRPRGPIPSIIPLIAAAIQYLQATKLYCFPPPEANRPKVRTSLLAVVRLPLTDPDIFKTWYAVVLRSCLSVVLMALFLGPLEVQHPKGALKPTAANTLVLTESRLAWTISHLLLLFLSLLCMQPLRPARRALPSKMS